MRMKEKEVDGVVVLALSGELWGGPECMSIVDELDRLGSSGKLDAVIDLSKVRHISSNALGVLIRARSHYARHGGMLQLCGANARVMSLFEITKLNLLFELRKNCREALEAVGDAS